jgi:phenylacetate-coenzyme A ligase PaaK-like adenylate-forming protein
MNSHLNKELKYLLNLAYEATLLWREKFEAAKLKPNDITSVDELLKAAKKGLYLQPKDLYNPKILPNYISEGRIYSQYFMTSGSTGMPKILPKTKDDIIRGTSNTGEAYEKLNLKGDRVLNLLPPSPAVSGVISTDVLAKLDYKVNVFHIGPAFLSNPLFLEKLIETFKPTSIFGLPTALYRLPEIVGKKIDNIKSLLTGGEPVTFNKLEKILKKYGAERIVDVYASCEDLVTAYTSLPSAKKEFIELLPKLYLN